MHIVFRLIENPPKRSLKGFNLMPLVSLVTATVKAALNVYTQCLLASSKSTTYEGMKVKFVENIYAVRMKTCHPYAGCQKSISAIFSEQF